MSISAPNPPGSIAPGQRSCESAGLQCACDGRFGRGRRRRYILVVMALTALTLATLSQRDGDSGPIGAAGGVAHRIVQPVTDAADSAFGPLHDWWHGFWHHGDVVAQNRKLRRRAPAVLAQSQDNTDAIEKLQQLESTSTRRTGTTTSRRARPWSAQRLATTRRRFTINRGSEAGIRVGMAVVVARRTDRHDRRRRGTAGARCCSSTIPTSAWTPAHCSTTTSGPRQTDDDGVLRVTFPANGQPKHSTCTSRLATRSSRADAASAGCRRAFRSGRSAACRSRSTPRRSPSRSRPCSISRA